MSEGVTKDWLVNDVREGKTEPNPHGGTLQKFYVDFEGSPDTYWRRKEGDKPEIGKSYYGTVSEGKYGPMFKLEQLSKGDINSFSAGSHNFGSSKREWKPESQYDPEKTARITRSHAQKVAVDFIRGTGELAALEPGVDTAGFLDRQLVAIIDWFEADVDAAAQKAAQGAGAASTGNGSEAHTPPFTGPAPAQADLEQQSSAEYLTQLLEGVGFTPAQTTVVQRYIESEFKDDQRASAEASLKDPERVQWAIQKLTEGAEHWSGEPLPVTTTADSDIPF